MFTGIIEDVGRVEAVTELDDGRRFTVRSPAVAPGLDEGASVSVDGACLTVVDPGSETFEVEAISTTLSRTVARGYEVGTPVNLERAMALGGRLDGHLVQGHVDGVAELLEVRREGTHRLLDVRIPPSVWKGTILHGSLTLNGISLTVNGLEAPDRCQVAIIPHTWAHTNLSAQEPGAGLNVEGDLIGKYVGKYLESLEGVPGRTGGPDEGNGDEGGGESTP